MNIEFDLISGFSANISFIKKNKEKKERDLNLNFALDKFKVVVGTGGLKFVMKVRILWGRI